MAKVSKIFLSGKFLALILAAVIVAAAIILLRATPVKITNFEECAAAGYPLQESFPPVCRTPDGRSFTQDISEQPLRSISKSEAWELINNCEAKGTYALHSGEAGLILKDGRFQPVSGTSDFELRENENPDCPFEQAIIE